ncbi:O-methyltransferase [Mariannaea sp. PMI_226]|nr:O-methyltransferase [Mariannaea sp. PMI_226]
MTLDKHSLQALCSKLVLAVNGLSLLKDDENIRKTIADLASDILDQATLPEERYVRDTITLMTMVAAQVFIKWGCFDAIPVDGRISYRDLAEKSDADVGLIRRFSHVLVAGKILRHDGKDHVAHTPKSLVYANSGPYIALARMNFQETLRSCTFMPAFFDEYKRIEPDGPVHCPYSYANGHPEMDIWEIMHQNPERTRNFMHAMAMSNAVLLGKTTYDFAWVREVMDQTDDRILFIDLGGGRGHAVQAICEQNKWLPKERCIVQDREEVIKEVGILKDPLLEGIQFMAHDFLLEQPVKGALFYHLRRCLHDYNDETCITILNHVSNAMAPDSRLLIVEQIMNDPPSQFDASFDIVMMTIGGKERSVQQFKALLHETGLRMLKIHGPDSRISVIECVKA